MNIDKYAACANAYRVEAQKLSAAEVFASMTRVQRARYETRKREAELFLTEAVVMRERGKIEQARLLERDGARYDVLAAKTYGEAVHKIAWPRAIALVESQEK